MTSPDRLLSAIRAALDDTERLARATIHPGHTGRWEFHHDAGDRFGDPLDPPNWWIELDRIGPPLTDNTGLGPDTMRHIARHDPAAVLRRVAADRDMLREAEALYELAAKDPTYTAFRGAATAYDIVLRALARGLDIDPEETP